MRVDIHAHYQSKEYIDLLASLGGNVNPFTRNLPAGGDQADLDARFQLMKDAGAEGAKLDLVWLPGKIGRDAELSEYLIDAWGKIGLKVNSVSKDVAAWTATSRAIAPESRSDMIVLSHGNSLGDSGQTIGSYLICEGSMAHVCDPKADQLYKDSNAATGETRVKALRAIWAYAYEEQPLITFFHQTWLHGVSEKLKWAPRPDSVLQFK